MCGVGLFLDPATSERVLMYFSCISSELTHGLRNMFALKKLTQPYARAGFAYAQLRYDNALSEYKQEGFSNGSCLLLCSTKVV